MSSRPPTPPSRRDAAVLFTGADQAAAYARHRPVYPATLFDHVRSYATAHNTPLRDCVDVATGSGQAAAGLARVFDAVVGIDASPAQVAAGNAARPAPNVEFCVGTAEATGLPSESADCVCVAEALHWFDIPKFYAEASRILRRNGLLAVVGYGAAVIADNPAADAALQHVFVDVLGPHWHPAKRLVDGLYVGVEPGAPLFKDVVRDEGVAMEFAWGVDAVVGFALSWSGYETYLTAHGRARGDAGDPVDALRAQLTAAAPPGGAPFRVVFPTVLITATKA